MKIAIAGYGREGEANYAYWSKNPENEVTIVDQKEVPDLPIPEGALTILGADAFERLDGFDIVVRTAGLAPHKIRTDGKIWTATNEFFLQCPAPIVGVTGTKGKGTTSSMITSILEAAGKKVHLLGNIGTAALGALDDINASDIVVFEMSSFQLWDIERSPHVAVVLGIEPDHLNVHIDMEDYVTAKGGIRRFQTADDLCIYHPLNEYARLIALSNPNAPMRRYGIAADGGAYEQDGHFMVGEHIICSTSVMQVPGKHNIENACAAISVAKYLHVSDDDIARGLESFEGLPHRLERVRELDGVTYYNDSFSSAPAATVAAINAFTDPEIVIVGGIDKGSDFTELIGTVAAHDNVKEVVLIGEYREALKDLFSKNESGTTVTVLDAKTMLEIVEYTRDRAAAGDIVLLSPGCASFDMFRDFYDRGDQFRSIVMSL